MLVLTLSEQKCVCSIEARLFSVCSLIDACLENVDHDLRKVQNILAHLRGQEVAHLGCEGQALLPSLSVNAPAFPPSPHHTFVASVCCIHVSRISPLLQQYQVVLTHCSEHQDQVGLSLDLMSDVRRCTRLSAKQESPSYIYTPS